VLFWSCVLIGSISRRRCGPCFAECFAGSRCQNGLTAPGKLVITAVGEVGGHFDCEEDQTTLSPDCPKPCQPDVRRRSPQNPGKKISAAQEISLTRSWRVLERVSERVVTTRQTGCGKGSPRRYAMTPDEQLMTIQELARYLGVPVGTLYQWRYRREGPPGFRVGRHVRYRRKDVEDWISQQMVDAER